MATFRYRAVTAAGALTAGRIEAESEADAVARIRALGHLPLVAVKAGAGRWRALLPSAATRRPSAATLAFATQELAALLAARLPLDRALAILVELEETRILRGPLMAALESVRGGERLADAFEATGAFPRTYTTMLRAGEFGGQMESALARLADYLARANQVRDAVRSALVYPAILMITGLLSAAFVMMFVLPEFAPLFEQSGKPLPWPTAVALDIGMFLSVWWWLVLALAAAAVLALRRLAATGAFRDWRDRTVLRLPVIGDLVRKTEVERFSRLLAALLTNGVALPQALLLVRDATGNGVIAAAIGETALSLKEGEPLAARLRRTGVFPPLMLDLVRVGEETGALEDMLARQADLYAHEVRHAVDRLLALLVPVLTIVMGLMVAGLIASILLAILSINDLAT